MKRKNPRCEGWRRHGGAFTLGPVTWTRCPREAVVMLTLKQEGKIKTWPACSICWVECDETGIQILKAKELPRRK